MKYKATIGLEIHAELKTNTKMFCNSRNDAEEKRSNVNICPICLGYPGTLPVINKEAVKHILKLGLALGGGIADFTEFDRKNYFYPDIPKGYQISQYKHPLVKGGKLNGVMITRVHLEEDTARSIHDGGEYSLIDFNRAGVPLMELVTEPVIHSAKEASHFAQELQLLLQYTGAGEANMEKGEMRVEANISVSNDKNFGTKVEVKNLNSFKAVEKAIEYEINRQIEIIERGEEIIQETRGWDEHKGVTFSQRLKEDSHDYRYFPDPDLPKLKISEIKEFEKKILTEELPELPWVRRERYKKNFSLKNEHANLLVNNKILADFFERVNTSMKLNPLLVSNYIASDLLGLLKSDPSLNLPQPELFAELIEMVENNKISSRGAKDILIILLKTKESPKSIAEKNNLFQNSDESELRTVAEKIIELHPDVVEDYKKGKQAAMQFLVGQGMKETKGSANPEMLKSVFVSLI